MRSQLCLATETSIQSNELKLGQAFADKVLQNVRCDNVNYMDLKTRIY